MISTMKIETKAFLGVFTLLGLSVVANLIMLYYSITSFDGLVEENYYLKGLNYQKEIEREKIQSKLGWESELHRTNNTFTVIARKLNTDPIKGANVSLNFFRQSQAGFDQEIKLKEIGNGMYQANVDLKLKGLWTVTTEIRKNNGVWKKKERITVN